MRELVAVILAWCAVGVGLVSAGERFPYIAYIVAERTPVRSGPGKEHYTTTHLDASARVEVYREDAEGWLAVRPPAGSFCWVRGEHLRMTDEPGVAEVVEEQVTAWIGTDLPHKVPYRWQVQLARGEFVEVLAQRPDTDGSGAWYRIAPPAGEFRWVHQQYVSKHPPQQVDPGIAPPPVEQELAGTQDDSQIELAAFRDVTPSEGPLPPGSDAPAEIRVPQNAVPASARTDARRPLTGSESIAELEVWLSSMVAHDMSTWDLEPVRAAADRLVTTASTTLDRARARMLLERIEQFEELRKRQLSLIEDAYADAAAAAKTPSGGDAEVQYDGQGWLMQVHANTGQPAPPYALVDKDGNILQFVSPAPGLNLHRYLEQQVGVYGQRGFIRTLQMPHVTAERVVVLQRHRDG